MRRSYALRQAIGRLQTVAEKVTDPELREAVDEAVAAAVFERMTRDTLAKQLAKRVSERQAHEMTKLYGPTGFSRAHIEPEIIADAILSSNLL